MLHNDIDNDYNDATMNVRWYLFEFKTNEYSTYTKGYHWEY